ncbi:MAG TPA: PAS domain S-box protein [Polyangiaceae bacterium]|nr:PAS domain S-box protein [Polyangiaceae bacterium]
MPRVVAPQHILWSQSLSARIGRWSMLVVVVCLVLLGSALLWRVRDAERDNARRLLAKNAEKVALLVSSHTENLTTVLALVESTAARGPGGAQGPDLLDWRRDTFEAALLAPRSPFTQVALLDRSGREVAHVSRFHTYLPGELVSRAGDPGIAEASAGRTWISPVRISPDSGLLSMQIAIPFRSPDFQGVLVADANVSRLWMEVSRLRIGQSGYAYLVDAEGRFLAYQRASEVLQRHGEDMSVMPPVSEFVRERGPASEPRVHAYQGLSGQEVIGLLVPIANTEWAVVVELSEAEAFASTRNLMKLLIALGFLGVIAAGVAGMLVSRRLLRPIEGLTAAARRIAGGDLKTPVATPQEEERADEVGALAHAFRTMQLELVSAWDSLEHRLEELTTAQTALSVSEERYRTIFENSGSALAIVETDATLGIANRELEILTGWSRQELVGRPFVELIAPREQGRVEAFRAHDVIDAHGKASTYELGLIGRSGKVFDTALSVARLPDGRFLAAFIDITELRKAERERAQSERMRQAVFDGSFQFMGLLSTDGRLLEVNRKAAEFTGLPREELVGRPFWETAWWAHSEEQQVTLRDAIARAATGEFVRFEANFVDRESKPRFIDISLTPVRDETGKVTLVIPEGRDITELRRHQEQLRQSQKMESIGQLAGGVAHDFNNLLTAIYGNVEMALSDTDPSDARYANLEQIQQAARSAERLTSQLLAFSRKRQLDPETLDLNERVESFSKMVARLIGERIHLEFRSAPTPCRVRVDPTQIEQIVFNLAVNARDAMPDGGRLSIELAIVSLDAAACAAHPRLSPGDHVALSVKDTGIGMSADVRARIFEPFFTTKATGKGTGLGLAIVHTAVEQCGGGIEVTSEPGHGTTFRILFPRLSEEALSRPARSAPKPQRGSESILLVEDNPLIRDTTERILGILGYRVVASPDAETALSLAAEWDGPLDLLFTDVVLPGIDGPALAERLRAMRPSLKTLFTSGYNDNVPLAEGLAQNRLRFLPKPYDAVTLASAVRGAIDAQPCPSADEVTGR